MSAQFSLGHLRRVAEGAPFKKRPRQDVLDFLETNKEEPDEVWVDIDTKSIRRLDEGDV